MSGQASGALTEGELLYALEEYVKRQGMLPVVLGKEGDLFVIFRRDAYTLAGEGETLAEAIRGFLERNARP